MKAFGISAVAIGFFLGFVVPYSLVVYIGPAIIAAATESQRLSLGGWFALLFYTVAIFGPVAAGYIAAHLAKVQPLLHGAAAGLLGAIAGIATAHTAEGALISVLVFLTGGIVGGWLQRWRVRRVSAL